MTGAIFVGSIVGAFAAGAVAGFLVGWCACVCATVQVHRANGLEIRARNARLEAEVDRAMGRTG